MSARLWFRKESEVPSLKLNDSSTVVLTEPQTAPSASEDMSSDNPLAPPLPPISELVEPPSETQPSHPELVAGGLHEILKSTDYWFALEINQLEKYARISAAEHARAGLPRTDVIAEDELDAEKVIRSRAAEIFLEWTAKVRRRVQDGIQSATVSAGTSIVQMRGAFDQLLLTINNVKESEAQLREARRTTVGGQKTVEYGGLMRAWAYWLMFAGLAIVDWIANIPVFGQLLPKDPGAQDRLEQAVADAGRHDYFGGILIQFQRIVSTPDISILAFGVVIFLMFLCHACGKNLRRVVAFRLQDEPLAELGLRSHRRQSWIPFGITATAIVIAVSFLFMSRAKLEPVTAARVTAAQKKVNDASTEVAKATEKGDADAMQLASDKQERTQRELVTTQADHDYAEGISGMNLPIGFLNIVLVLTATTASYLHDRASLSEVAFGDPHVTNLITRIAILRDQMVAQRSRLRELDSATQKAIAQANYLAQSLPLREWPAKAKRLEAAIPIFRSENAQLRGVDVANIRAFEVERPLNLAATREDEAFQLPVELKVWESEFTSLRKELDALQAEVSIAASVEV